MRSPRFSMSDFKNWLSQQEDMKQFFNLSEEEGGETVDPRAKFIGQEVKPKVSREKLSEKIEVEEGDADQLLDELIENGGVIADLNGKNLLIEVESGSFYMPRFCVKIVRDE